jgi:hypothetical protein
VRSSRRDMSLSRSTAEKYGATVDLDVTPLLHPPRSRSVATWVVVAKATLVVAAVAGLALFARGAGGVASSPGGVASRAHPVSQRATPLGETGGGQVLNDNTPIYYVAPAGAHAGKTSVVCLSPKVWSTSLGLLLLAGYNGAEVEAAPHGGSRDARVLAKYNQGYDPVAAAHDALTVPWPPAGKAVDVGLVSKADRYLVTRDPLDRLYSGFANKIECQGNPPNCECGNVAKYLPSMFWEPPDDLSEALAKISQDWTNRDMCASPDFGKFVDWLDLAFSSDAFTKHRVHLALDSWFNHFVPQTWMGCGFDIENELTILKTEEESVWYPGFIDNLGLEFAHKLDGKSWGPVPGGAPPRKCFYQCGSLSCDEMVGGTCPYEPPDARTYEHMYTPEVKKKACRIFANDLAVLGYTC